MFPSNAPIRVTDGMWAGHEGTVHESGKTETLVKLRLKSGHHILVGFANNRIEVIP